MPSGISAARTDRYTILTCANNVDVYKRQAFNAVYLLPKFAELYGMPLDSIVGLGHAIKPSINSVTTLALFAVAPMNLMKGGIVSIVTMLI